METTSILSEVPDSMLHHVLTYITVKHRAYCVPQGTFYGFTCEIEERVEPSIWQFVGKHGTDNDVKS